MTAPVVLDASVLISYLEPANDLHEEAIALILATLGMPRRIHALTFAEVLVGAVRKGQEQKVDDATRGNLGCRVLGDGGDSWPLHLARVRARTRLEMPGAVVLAAALEIGGQVATFDEALRAAARSEGALFEG